jgi:hypothetical protein
MRSISTHEGEVHAGIARRGLVRHLLVRIYRDQVAACWRVYTQLAGAPGIWDRQLLHRASSQLRRPLGASLPWSTRAPLGGRDHSLVPLPAPLGPLRIPSQVALRPDLEVQKEAAGSPIPFTRFAGYCNHVPCGRMPERPHQREAAANGAAPPISSRSAEPGADKTATMITALHPERTPRPQSGD